MNVRNAKWVLVAGSVLAAAVASAQPAGGPMGDPQMGGGMGGPMRVPMGRWWENPKVVSQLGLTPEQTQKLEAITLNEATAMVDLKAAVEKAEISLRAASDATPFDARRVRDAFGVFLQARNKLEMQRFEMLLKTREVLTADQWRQLREFARERRMERGRGGRPGAGEQPNNGPGGWDE
jgi:Spy/CpxP family protein refolding chaperone